MRLLLQQLEVLYVVIVNIGYQIGVFNTCQDSISETIGWGDNELMMVSINTAIMPIGAIVGAVYAGKLAKKRGGLFVHLF